MVSALSPSPPLPPPPIIMGGLNLQISLQLHYFISLETANTQKSEMLLLRISSGNVNALVFVICSQIYQKIP